MGTRQECEERRETTITNRADVLARYGLAGCSMTTIGAEKTPEFPNWRIKVTCDGARLTFMDVGQARQLAAALRRVGEADLAKRIELAVEVGAKRDAHLEIVRRPGEV
jgi:hypothetical protein